MEDVRLLILLQETDFSLANLRVKSKVKTGRVKTRGLSLQRCNSVLDSGKLNTNQGKSEALIFSKEKEYINKSRKSISTHKLTNKVNRKNHNTGRADQVKQKEVIED